MARACKIILSTSVAAMCAAASTANAITLRYETSSEAISVDVDAYGASASAFFNPLGSPGTGNLFSTSNVQITFDSSPAALNTALVTGPTTTSVGPDGASVTSQFSVDDLNFTLNQFVFSGEEAGSDDLAGSILSQTYDIENTGSETADFSLIRYLDAALSVDPSLDYSGGVLNQGGTRILFQATSSDDASNPGVFLGITASLGNAPGQEQQEFAIDPCCGVTLPLSNSVTGDLDGDGIIQMPDNLTFSLQGDYQIAAGETATFVTNTLFGSTASSGSGEVEGPGATELDPILPTRTETGDVTRFEFDLSALDLFDVTEEELFGDTFASDTVWIDPPVSVGYTYEVNGAAFDSITAPSLAAVADGDATYTVEANGETFDLMAGGTLMFSGTVSQFVLRGIDPDLMLDPENPQAFPLGVSLRAFTATTVTVTQTAIVADTMPAVPLPAPVLLLGAALASLLSLRRVGRAA